jgi:hypothetical protein
MVGPWRHNIATHEGICRDNVSTADARRPDTEERKTPIVQYSPQNSSRSDSYPPNSGESRCSTDGDVYPGGILLEIHRTFVPPRNTGARSEPDWRESAGTPSSGTELAPLSSAATTLSPDRPKSASDLRRRRSRRRNPEYIERRSTQPHSRLGHGDLFCPNQSRLDPTSSGVPVLYRQDDVHPQREQEDSQARQPRLHYQNLGRYVPSTEDPSIHRFNRERLRDYSAVEALLRNEGITCHEVGVKKKK